MLWERYILTKATLVAYMASPKVGVLVMKRIVVVVAAILTMWASTCWAQYYQPDIVLTDKTGIWIDCRTYSSLANAITAIGATEAVLVISDNETCDDLTIPANVKLFFLGDGRITVNAGKVLDLNTEWIYAGDGQIFGSSGDIDFLQGMKLHASWFASVDAIEDLIDDDNVPQTILFTSQESTTGNVSFDKYVTLEFTAGGQITVANLTTLTIEGNIIAPRTRIFAGTGTVEGENNTVLDATFPEWWGAECDGSTDDSAEIQAAIDFWNQTADSKFDNTIFGGTVSLAAGVYRADDIILKSSVRIVGQGELRTIIKPVSFPSTNAVFYTTGGDDNATDMAAGIEIRDVHLTAASTVITNYGNENTSHNDGTGIILEYATNCRLENVKITGFIDSCLILSVCMDSEFINLDTSYCGDNHADKAAILFTRNGGDSWTNSGDDFVNLWVNESEGYFLHFEFARACNFVNTKLECGDDISCLYPLIRGGLTAGDRATEIHFANAQITNKSTTNPSIQISSTGDAFGWQFVNSIFNVPDSLVRTAGKVLSAPISSGIRWISFDNCVFRELVDQAFTGGGFQVKNSFFYQCKAPVIDSDGDFVDIIGNSFLVYATNSASDGIVEIGESNLVEGNFFDVSQTITLVGVVIDDDNNVVVGNHFYLEPPSSIDIGFPSGKSGVVIEANRGNKNANYDTVDTAAPTLPPWGLTRLDTSSNDITATLPDGLAQGVYKTITISDQTSSAGGGTTVTITNHEDGAATVHTYKNLNDHVTYQWVNGVWVDVVKDLTP